MLVGQILGEVWLLFLLLLRGRGRGPLDLHEAVGGGRSRGFLAPGGDRVQLEALKGAQDVFPVLGKINKLIIC